MIRIPALARRALAASLALLLLVGLVGAPGAAAQSLPDLNRAGVVLQFFAAGNDEDVDGMMATVADNATWISGAACPARNPCLTADAARRVFEANVAAHTSFKVTSIEVMGGTVVARVEVQNDGTRAQGVDRISLTVIAQVPQEQITFWLTLPD